MDRCKKDNFNYGIVKFYCLECIAGVNFCKLNADKWGFIKIWNCYQLERSVSVRCIALRC